jgi:hypothetical protein
MNAKKYDEATGKFVDRAKALTRRDGQSLLQTLPPVSTIQRLQDRRFS